MAQPTISIVGAGIGGLTLGRCLLQRGIRTVLYEKAPANPRHNYGIALHQSSYKPLLPCLSIDEPTLKSRTAVDAAAGGNDQAAAPGNSTFRAHRGKLEELLRQDLNIEWEHTLNSVDPAPDGRLSLCFENGTRVPSDIVIAVDGPHSVLRKQYLPGHDPTVLPYIAFNGRRKVDRAVFDKIYMPTMRDTNMIQWRLHDVNLCISTTELTGEMATLSWVYSRPARGEGDALYRPHRSNAAAREIPADFFEEVAALGELVQPFRDVFDAERLKRERILHWLMRSGLVPTGELKEVGKVGVWFMGDAVHAEQIVGGCGANAAIDDAVSLAEHIAKHGVGDIGKWYSSREESWKAGFEESRRSIAEIHRLEGECQRKR